MNNINNKRYIINILVRIISKSGDFVTAKTNLRKVKFNNKKIHIKTINQILKYYRKQYNNIDTRDKVNRLKFNYEYKYKH